MCACSALRNFFPVYSEGLICAIFLGRDFIFPIGVVIFFAVLVIWGRIFLHACGIGTVVLHIFQTCSPLALEIRAIRKRNSVPQRIKTQNQAHVIAQVLPTR